MRYIKITIIFMVMIFLSSCSNAEENNVIKYMIDNELHYTTVVEEGVIPKEFVPQTEQGFIFLGWFVDEELTIKYEFNSQLSGDLTLYGSYQDYFTILVEFLLENGNYNVPEDGVDSYNYLIEDENDISYSMSYTDNANTLEQYISFSISLRDVSNYESLRFTLYGDMSEFDTRDFNIFMGLVYKGDNTHWNGLIGEGYDLEENTIETIIIDYTQSAEIKSELIGLSEIYYPLLMQMIDDYCETNFVFTLFDE